MSFYIRISRKCNEYLNILLAPHRRKMLNNIDFSIISNNCWGGKVYQYFGLPYLSPTIGLYFYSDDYIRFINQLRYYLNVDLIFINYQQSKHYNDLVRKNQTSVPIGILNDVEIIFLHCKSEQEAKEKWVRRVERVNYNNIIIKFSQMNMCTDIYLREFDQLPYGKKLMFVNKPNNNLKSAVYFEGFENQEQVLDDTTNFGKYVDIVKLINEPVKGI